MASARTASAQNAASMFNIAKSDNATVEDLVQNPIACGYLLDFCEKSFCAENLRFWVAVDQFKDRCRAMGNANVDLKQIENWARDIFNEYLSEYSKTEVSLPSADRKITNDRLQDIAKYQSEVFDVALRDPLNTMKKDIRGRFITG